MPAGVRAPSSRNPSLKDAKASRRVARANLPAKVRRARLGGAGASSPPLRKRPHGIRRVKFDVGRGGSGRAARHRAYTWGMANNDQGYDPFEPGHSTPEFEQFARENQKYRKASHARGGASAQKRTSSAGARSRSAVAGNAGSKKRLALRWLSKRLASRCGFCRYGRLAVLWLGG